VAHAEAVLLVDDQQAEALELDVRLQELVRPDDDVDAARRQIAGDRTCLCRRQEARQHLDAHGIPLEAAAEGVEVLLRQHRRRHQHGDLFAVHHRGERGAHGDLGLAVPDVATDEPVHRLGAL
jgi:hypothetical protein